MAQTVADLVFRKVRLLCRCLRALRASTRAVVLRALRTLHGGRTCTHARHEGEQTLIFSRTHLLIGRAFPSLSCFRISVRPVARRCYKLCVHDGVVPEAGDHCMHAPACKIFVLSALLQESGQEQCSQFRVRLSEQTLFRADDEFSQYQKSARETSRFPNSVLRLGTKSAVYQNCKPAGFFECLTNAAGARSSYRLQPFTPHCPPRDLAPRYVHRFRDTLGFHGTVEGWSGALSVIEFHAVQRHRKRAEIPLRRDQGTVFHLEYTYFISVIVLPRSSLDRCLPGAVRGVRHRCRSRRR